MATCEAPLVLIVLDGWGYSQHGEYNAIASATTPHWDAWWSTKQHCLLDASGPAVGLPAGQMGNSEVGHMHMGAGRLIDQDLSRINKAILDQSFFTNSAFLSTLNDCKKRGAALHMMGLLSDGGVHSHQEHLFALLNLAKSYELNGIFVHAFLDGRDTPPQSAMSYIDALQECCDAIPHCKIASVSGRYYAMDRDKRWERTQQVYDLLTLTTCPTEASSAKAALESAYSRGENDEFVKPTRIENCPAIADGDNIIFMNFRADRARQLSHALIDTQFDYFTRDRHPQIHTLTTLASYSDNIAAEVAFPPLYPKNTLGECLANASLRQLRIAETEKYAHVTFFFNGGEDIPFQNEERILIPSKKIATYDLDPTMCAGEVTEKLIEALQQNRYDVIICNLANADMVGHSGNFSATVNAINFLDTCLGQIADTVLQKHGHVLITSDHGNAECMFDSHTQQPHTAHTSNLVPFIYLGNDDLKISRPEGQLTDIAPTILYCLGLNKPSEMTGKSLLCKKA